MPASSSWASVSSRAKGRSDSVAPSSGASTPTMSARLHERLVVGGEQREVAHLRGVLAADLAAQPAEVADDGLERGPGRTAALQTKVEHVSEGRG